MFRFLPRASPLALPRVQRGEAKLTSSHRRRCNSYARGSTGGFVRRTAFAPGERRVIFRQIDNDAIAAVVSDEASAVTPPMSKIYLRFIQARAALWERPASCASPAIWTRLNRR